MAAHPCSNSKSERC